jgi:hypothetical protein
MLLPPPANPKANGQKLRWSLWSSNQSGSCRVGFDSTPHRPENTREFRQQDIPGILDDADTVGVDFGINQLAEMRFEA